MIRLLRNERAQKLQADLVLAKRGQTIAMEIIDRAEQATLAKLADLRAALAGDRQGLREVFTALFPEGLHFNPVESGHRNKMVWEIEGVAELRPGSNLKGDPTGT